MSEHDGTQSSTKQRRSRKTNTANQENSKQSPVTQHPTNDDKEAWKAYWEAQGQSWRTEPEIDTERQEFLTERRNIIPNIEQGIYPFKDIKLNRADIEWLLATFENGRGPIFWNDGRQRPRCGLDLRGADLREVDLQSLPLTRMLGGLTVQEWDHATPAQREMAAVHLERATLNGAQLNDAFLRSAYLEKTALHWTHLEGASLRSAHFEGASLRWASLTGAYLQEAYLQGADLHAARLQGANLRGAKLAGANLELAFFDSGTNIRGIDFCGSENESVSVVDLRWGDVNLAVVDWKRVIILGDESVARQKKRNGIMKDRLTRLNEYEAAIRANRQLAIVLQTQGINEQAARFSYRAQKLQRIVFRLQRKFVQYLFSSFLDLLAGYGYKPWRSFVAYLLVITLFATAYFVIGHIVGPGLSPVGSFVFSMTSFHGRGFFPGGIGLDDPLTVLAAIEAFVGLLIEVTFIATLTQRLFGK